MNQKYREKYQDRIATMNQDEIDTMRWKNSYDKKRNRADKIFISNLLDHRERELQNKVEVL